MEISLGYDDKSNGFRVWIPEEKKVQVTRDVAFLKNSENPTNGFYHEFIPEEVEVAIQPLNQNQILAPEIHGENEEDGSEEIAEAGVDDIELSITRSRKTS